MPAVTAPEVSSQSSAGRKKQNRKKKKKKRGKGHNNKASTTIFNAPGKWRVMISYAQNDSAVHATRLHGALGVPVWLDVMMTDKSAAAMHEAVENSDVVLVLLSPGYFKSDWCCKELRWAKNAKKLVLSAYSSDYNVGQILGTAPKDLKKWISAIDSKKLDNSDPELFAVGVNKLRRAAKGALDPSPAGAPRSAAQPPPQVQVMNRIANPSHAPDAVEGLYAGCAYGFPQIFTLKKQDESTIVMPVGCAFPCFPTCGDTYKVTGPDKYHGGSCGGDLKFSGEGSGLCFSADDGCDIACKIG